MQSYIVNVEIYGPNLPGLPERCVGWINQAVDIKGALSASEILAEMRKDISKLYKCDPLNVRVVGMFKL